MKFAVDIHFDVAHSIVVDADSPDDAYAKIEEKIKNGEIRYTDKGFSNTDDYELKVSGEEVDGKIEYY